MTRQEIELKLSLVNRLTDGQSALPIERLAKRRQKQYEKQLEKFSSYSDDQILEQHTKTVNKERAMREKMVAKIKRTWEAGTSVSLDV
ncbi:hypothetical protein JW962_01125 [Candidatus Dojkabacteria bacterium]|nr:hypothetical protein [Candidatus Dojkabacteria bacterium]